MTPIREAMIELVERGDIVGFMERDKVRCLHKDHAAAYAADNHLEPLPADIAARLLRMGK
jgi:hypothetical protein